MQLIIANATKMKSQNSNDVAANKTKMVGNSLQKYIHFGAHLCGPGRGGKMNSKHASGFAEEYTQSTS